MCAKTSTSEDVKRVPIFIWGKRYLVPDGLTIMTAIEFAGYQLVRGVGCRGGVCGACATVYRLDGECKINVGLACQTVIQPNMYIAQLPFFPARRKAYDLEDFAQDAVGQILKAYPETFKCLGCNTCTKSCPMEVNVMKYISYVLKGDIPTAAKLCFDCVQCGICAARCPAEISQYHVAQMVRRIYGRHLAPPAAHLATRVKQVSDGRYDASMAELQGLPMDELKKRYVEREAEPQNSQPGWMPKERKYL